MATVSGSFTAAGASAALQLTGLETVAISLSGTFRVRRTAANTYVAYRVG